MNEKNNSNQKAFSSSVLYYPTIEFQDETWLKSALLTWEKIYRIVPASYKPFDSDDVIRAIDLGCIENINLTKSDLTQTASSFQEFWDNVPFIPAALEGTDDTEARLHPDKVDSRIRPILESLAKNIDAEGFLRLSPEIANAYMLLLSETISRRRQIPKLTDNPDMFAIMHYFANDGNFDEWLTNDESKEVTTTVVLENILPDGISDMDMKEVLKFRDQFKSYREDFRNSIMSFTQQLALIEDQEFAQIEMLNSMRKCNDLIEDFLRC
jgi:DNA-directed RNA polymerase specialized sigma54-like protein